MTNALAAGDDEPSARSMGWHPSVDEFADGFIVFATPDDSVLFTEPVASFLAEAAARGVRPVLVTALDARVSPFVSFAMRASGGVWAVQAVDCSTFDALTGYRIGALPELWGAQDTPRSRFAAFTKSQEPVRVLSFDIRTRGRADEQSRVGRVAEALSTVAGEIWECWGTREPLLEPWDTAALTEVAQRWMPDSGWLRVSGTGGSFGHVQVSRTSQGLAEHTVVGFPLADSVSGSGALDAATEALERIAQDFLVEVASASLVGYERVPAGVVQAARARLASAPIAVLIGPRGVRDLAISVDGLSESHDVRRLGRAKTPSLLVRFTDRDMGLWEQVGRLGLAIGPERIAHVLGVDLEEQTNAH